MDSVRSILAEQRGDLTKYLDNRLANSQMSAGQVPAAATVQGTINPIGQQALPLQPITVAHLSHSISLLEESVEPLGHTSAAPSTMDRSSDEGDSLFEGKETGDKKRRKDRREAWARKLREVLPQDIRETLPKQPVEEGPDQGALLFGQKRPESKAKGLVPIASGLTVQLKKKARQHLDRVKKSKKPWPAAKKVAGHYRTSEPEESLLALPHAIPAILMDEVPLDRTKVRHVSSEARLNPKSEFGKAEVAALDKAASATTALRVTNNLTLDLQATMELVAGLRKATADFRARPALDIRNDNIEPVLVQRETEVSEFCGDIATKLVDMSEALDDALLCASDFFNLNAASYVSAISERRQTWLKASRVPEEIQKEISGMPIVLPEVGVEGPLDLLGPEGATRLEQMNKAREKAQHNKISALAVVGAASQSNKKKPFPAQKNFNQKPKTSDQPAAPFQFKSPLAEPQHPQRGGFNSFRPRGRGGRGRGRGAQQTPQYPQKSTFGRGQQKPDNQ